LALDANQKKEGRYLVRREGCGHEFTALYLSVSAEAQLRCPTCVENKKPYIGRRYGRVLVVGEYVYKNQGQKYVRQMRYWPCRCDCGTEWLVGESCLKKGDTVSCGCKSIDFASSYFFKDIRGMVFGSLVAIEPIKLDGETAFRWVCYCDPKHGGCGTITPPIRIGSLTTGQTKSCGCRKIAKAKEQVKLMHIANRKRGEGEPIAQRLRSLTSYYDNFVWPVLERDDFTCQFLGTRGESLVVHHIKPFAVILREHKITTLEDGLNCTELWDINNGVTLSKQIHATSSTNSMAFHKMYGARSSTAEDFRTWFAERPFKEGRCYYENWTN
jgi:hypothetical protein